jgi:small subunit ribosomal protein S16
MLTIRLTRVGKKKDASFRVIVIDSKRKVKAGNYLEMLGSYDPRVNTTTLKAERIKHWLSEGAQPSDTVYNLLISNNILLGKKRNVLPKKTVPKPTSPEASKATEKEEEKAVAEVSAPETGDTSVAAEVPVDTITE